MATGYLSQGVRTITCEGCGETVTRRMPPKARYCSRVCYRGQPCPERRTGENRKCAQCQAEFYIPGHRVARGKARFCSRGCHDIHQGRNKTEHICKTCSTLFRQSPVASVKGNPTYCSMPCRDADPALRERLLAMNVAQQSRRTTKAEAAGYALLDSLGVDYQRQQPFAGKFTPDATIPAARLVVQFDGDYWHDRNGTSTEPRIRRRVALDQSQDAYLRARGWDVLRLWETDLHRDPVGCAEQIKQHLQPPP